MVSTRQKIAGRKIELSSQKERRDFFYLSVLLLYFVFSPFVFASSQSHSLYNKPNTFTTLFSKEKTYQPYVEVGGIKYFNQESKAAGVYDLFFPLFTPFSNHSKQVVFTDLRIFDRSGSSFEGNMHIGYRIMLPERKQLFGIYTSFDRRKSEKKNFFNQVTLGGEFWQNKWFIGGNLYISIGKKRRVAIKERSPEVETKRKEERASGRVVQCIDTTIITKRIFEKSLFGVDAEIGHAFTEQVTGYAGGYWFQDGFFESAKKREAQTKWGPRLRLTYDYHPIHARRVFGILDGVSLEAGIQHDKPRGISGYMGFKLKAGLTYSEKTTSNLSGFERHMTELVRRDPDIVLNETKISETITTTQERRELPHHQGYTHVPIEGLDGGTVESLLLLFGLPSDATWQEVRKQYRKQALIYHPDKKTGNTKKFIYYNQIYECLKKKWNEKKQRNAEQNKGMLALPPSPFSPFSHLPFTPSAYSKIHPYPNVSLEVYSETYPETYPAVYSYSNVPEEERVSANHTFFQPGKKERGGNKTTLLRGNKLYPIKEKKESESDKKGLFRAVKPFLFSDVQKSEMQKAEDVKKEGKIELKTELQVKLHEEITAPKIIFPNMTNQMNQVNQNNRAISFPFFFFFRSIDPFLSIHPSEWNNAGRIASGLEGGNLFLKEINLDYAYEAQDIQALLLLRLQQSKIDLNTVTLIPSFLFNEERAEFSFPNEKEQRQKKDGGKSKEKNRRKSQGKKSEEERWKSQGNQETRVHSSLKSFLNEFLGFFEQTAFIPLNVDHQHWVGLVAYFNERKDLKEVEYVDSLKKEDSFSLEIKIEKVLREGYGQEFPFQRVEGWIQEKGEAHCGPLLVENLIRVVQRSSFVQEEGGKERKREGKNIEEIRGHHLHLLEQYRPEYQFSFRQKWNIRTFEYGFNQTILLKGGIFIDFIPLSLFQKDFQENSQEGFNKRVKEIFEGEVGEKLFLDETSFLTFALFGAGRAVSPEGISLSESIKQYAKIVIPFSLTGLVTTANNYIHSIFLSRLDKEALAANGLIMTMQFIVCLGSDIPYTVGILIPRVLGKDKDHDVGRIVRQGVFLSGMIAIPQMVTGFFSGTILNAFGQSEKLTQIVQQYFIGYSLGIPARLGMGISDQLVLGTAHPHLVLMRTLVYSTLVTVLGYGFMFGEWGLPELHIAGLGYAESLASWLTCGGMALYFGASNHFSSYQLFRNDWRGGSVLGSLIKTGFPMAIQSLFLTIGYSSLSIMKGWLGANTLLAQQIVTQTLFFFYCIEGGIAQASTTLVSRALGSGDVLSARRLGNVGLVLGSSIAVLGEVLFVMAPSLLASVFIETNDPENESVLDLTNALFFTEGLILISESVAQIAKGNLRGSLSTRIGVVSDVVKVGTLLGLGYLFSFPLSGGLIGISCAEWIGTSVGAWILLKNWFRQ